MKKRMISLLLCLCMVFSLLPTAVLAADGEDSDASAGSGQVMQQDSEKPGDQEDLGDLKNSEDSDDSDALQLLGEGLGSELFGNCGATEADHVTWELTDDDGDGSYTLTISGNGAMKDYTSQAGETVADPTGWYALKDSITEIKIEEGVTGFGNWAFSYLTNVVKANIPASITSLGDHIFRGDTALTTVEWASGFNAPVITDTDSKDDTYTGNYVPTSMFDGCTSLGSGKELSAWLPASFTGVGCAAFRGTQFTVDFAGWNTLNYIGAYGFAGMPNLDSFTLSNEITLGLRGGASNAFNSSGLKSLTVADGIEAIPSGLCNGCEQLSSVALADFVTTIAMYAFRNTEALKEIDLKNVQTINGYAFQGSGLTALVLPESVKKVESHAFEACTSLTKVTINAAGLTLDNNNTFAGCSALSTVVTSADSKINGLNTGAFGPYKTDYAQAPVENIEINGTVDTLNFSTLASLKSLKINGKNTWYGNILPSGFENLVINGDNWNISGYQFAGKTPIKHLVVSAAEVSDNEGKTEAAFRSNFNLETAQFTGTTVKLHAKMFMGCTSLNWLDLSAVDTLTVGSGCFGDDFSDSYGASKENPNKFNENCVIYAKDAAAAQTLRSNLGKKGIVLIVNGGTVDVTAATAGFGAVSWEGFTAKWYEEGGTPVTGDPVTGKTYYVQWTKGVFRGSCGATGNEDNVDWTLEYEGNDEFTLRITGTGAMADYKCNITRSDATQPWRESETGVAPTAITRVVVGGSVTNIGEFACDGLSQVKEYNIAASVAKIGAWGVCGQNAETYNLNGSTHYVTKDGVLMSADEKTLVSYPGGKDAVDEYVIPNTVETILAGAFVGSDAKKVVIPNSVTNFPRFSFGGSAVEEIEFNANVKTLEDGAFSGLSKLKSLVFGGTTLTTIRDQACSDLSSLTEITFPDSLTTIEGQAFKVLPEDGAAAPNLKKVTFGKGMSTIGGVVFLRQSALEVIDMTHCAKPTLKAVGEFNSRGFDGSYETPYTNTPIVYTADAGVAELVKQSNGNYLSYAVTNGGTFPADTVFETGKLAKPKKDGCLFLGWYENANFSGEEVNAVEDGKTYYAKWMDHIPEPTDDVLANGEVTVNCLTPTCSMSGGRYGLAQAVFFGDPKPMLTKNSETNYTVTYDADAFASKAADKIHSLYSADTLPWTLTYDGSQWNLAPQTPGVDDVVLVTHAPTTYDEVTKFIDGQTDVIHTSCVNGETATCAYGLMVAFAKKDHVVSVKQEKGSNGQPIRGSYIATLKVDQFAEARASVCNGKNFQSSPRAHDVRSQNPVQWRFQVRQAEVGTDTGAEKQYVWSAEPVTPGTDDVCTIAHNWVVTFDPANDQDTFTRDVKYDGKATEPAAPEKEGCEFTGWYLNENDEFDFNTTITADTTLTAHWTIKTAKITYSMRGVVKDTDVVHLNNPETYDANDLPITLNAPKLKNDEWPQKFLNWRDADGNVVSEITEFSGDLELYAYWQFPVRYTVYDENGNVIDSLSTTEWFNDGENGDYTIRVLDEAGHDFDGWYQKPADIGNANKRVASIYKNTKFELFGKLTRKEYTVTASLFLNGEDMKIPKSVKGLFGDPINYDGENGLNAQLKEAALAADAANNPNPDRVDINIRLNDKSGKPFDAATYGQEGYNWRDMEWTNPTTGAVKKWIAAYVWAYVDTYYDVTFNSDGGSAVDPQTVKYGDELAVFNEPTKDGYKFLGWYTEADEAFNLTTPITKSMTLTAKWERNTYTIVYHGNGGVKVKDGKTFEQVTSAKLPIGEPTTLKSAEFTRDNYEFLGWSYFENGSVYFKAAEKGVLFEESDFDENGNVHLYAIWKRLSYPVTLRYNANTTDEVANMPEPLEQTKNSDETGNAEFDISDKIPTRAGYRFLGWALNKPDAAEDDIAFKAGETSLPFVVNYQDNITLYAVWQAQYTVTYTYESSNVTHTVPYQVKVPEDDGKYAVGEMVRVAAKPKDVESGEYIWKFVTWKLNGDDVDPNAQVPMVEGGLTFVGIWECTRKEYGVTYSYVSADPAIALPQAVLDTRPTNEFTYTTDEWPETAAKPDDVIVGEYVWKFVTWKFNGIEVAPRTRVQMVSGGLHFEGVWQKELIHYSLTIQYVDKNDEELDESHVELLPKGGEYKVDSPKIKGYKLKNKHDAVIEGTMPGHDLTIKVVYVRKTSGGSSVQIESPNKPKQDNSLKFNTEDHFAFVNGYPDGTVKPTGDVTRAEVAAILYRVMDADCVKTYETTRCSFSDVVRGDWFNLYVATLENADVIVDTRTNGKFRPNEAITRAELAAMLAQFADIKSAANSFNDVSARHWASDEIAVCAKMGWINGYPDGSFRPDATITRAEMMAMINRALGRTPKSADDLLSGMKTWRDNANVNAWYYLDVQEATNSHTYTKSGTHETWKKLR